MEKIRIEKNIPIPEKGYQGKKYPFDEMEIGDSFSAGEYTNMLAVSVRGSADNYLRKSKSNKRFSIRKCDNFVRCWRIE